MKSRLLLIISITVMVVIAVSVFGFAAMTYIFDQSNSQKQPSKVTFPLSTIKIDDVSLDVQIADTEPRRVRGLMFQEQLPYDQGMLFVFDEPGLYPLWMLNMQFVLDIVWFDKNGNVVHIETDAHPCKTTSEITNCQSIIPEEEALYILEVTSGLVEKFGITKDSKFSWIAGGDILNESFNEFLSDEQEQKIGKTSLQEYENSEPMKVQLPPPNSTDSPLMNHSTLFRIFSFHEDDYGKTNIRIEKQYMERLGVGSGDTVKVIGNREVPAIIFPLESSYKKSYDPVMEYLDEKSKDIPQVRISDVISRNLKNGITGGSLVYIEKLDSQIVQAKTLVLGGMKEYFPYDKNYLNLDALREDFVAGKGDHVMIAQKDNHLQQTRFVILDGTPEGQFWRVGDDTKFEFTDIEQDTFYSNINSKNLINTIESGKTIHDEKFEMTLDKIEIFENSSKIWFTTREEYRDPEKIPFPMFAEPAFVSITDDWENSYNIHAKQMMGGSWSEEKGMVNSMWFEITPPINPETVKKLSMTVAEMTWFGPLLSSNAEPHENQDDGWSTSYSKKENPETRFIYDRPTAKTIVKGGPWEFEIPLS